MNHVVQSKFNLSKLIWKSPHEYNFVLKVNCVYENAYLYTGDFVMGDATVFGTGDMDGA